VLQTSSALSRRRLRLRREGAQHQLRRVTGIVAPLPGDEGSEVPSVALSFGHMTTRLGMMLPGAVSLGAYEGGALAAVLKAVQASGGELVVDAIASASAGSMTGLIACRALLCGADPVELMQQTWVALPQLGRLKVHDRSAPLTMERIISAARTLLGPDVVPDGTFRQAEPVHLSMALTALGGLTYAMPHQRDPHDPRRSDPELGQALLATTYVDFYTAELNPGSQPKDFLAVLDGAMASGSTPVGFPPRWLDRDDVEAGYEKNGVLTPSGKPFALWYSDGGDLDNQPLGRLLDLVQQVHEQPGDERFIVVLNIEPAAPPTWEGTWFDSKPLPLWLSTLLHVNQIRSSQSLYDDLRRLEKTNRHIAWISHVARNLEGALDDTARASFQTAVNDAASQVAHEREQVRRAIRDAAGTKAPGASELATGTLEDLLLRATGLDGKREITVEVISPEVDPGVHLTAAQQLSGDFLFHFGGFFDPKYRQSDFALGYRNAKFWLEWWLEGRVRDPGAVLEAVEAGYTSLPWRDERQGGASIATLSFREKVQGIELLGHIGRVLLHDLALNVTRGVKLRWAQGEVLSEMREKLHLASGVGASVAVGDNPQKGAPLSPRS